MLLLLLGLSIITIYTIWRILLRGDCLVTIALSTIFATDILVLRARYNNRFGSQILYREVGSVPLVGGTLTTERPNSTYGKFRIHLTNTTPGFKERL